MVPRRPERSKHPIISVLKIQLEDVLGRRVHQHTTCKDILTFRPFDDGLQELRTRLPWPGNAKNELCETSGVTHEV
jgi:hypothetical protein